MAYTPFVVERDGSVERTFDIYSRLLRDRIIFLNGEIDDAVSKSICAQLLFLQYEDGKKDISLYINSPGGSVPAGLAIFDTMNYISCDVSTVCMGMAASMGSFLLMAGAKGKRYALPNSTIMIHQLLSGYQGQATDIEIHAKHIARTKKRLNQIYCDITGKSYDEVLNSMERDNYMTPEEALDYGLIDEVIVHNKNRG